MLLTPGDEPLLLPPLAIYIRPCGHVNLHEKQLGVSPSGVQPWRRLAPEGAQDAPERAISGRFHMGRRINPCYPTGVFRIRGSWISQNRSTCVLERNFGYPGSFRKNSPTSDQHLEIRVLGQSNLMTSDVRLLGNNGTRNKAMYTWVYL